jgi:hypothetical protein
MIEETFEQTRQRKRSNIDEVKKLIQGSEWSVDNCEYDEMDGYILVTIYKEKIDK